MTNPAPLTDQYRNRRRSDRQRTLILALFARIDAVPMMVAMGCVLALGLFLATAILLLKGSAPGVPVGQNLSALSTFLPGYDVSWIGAVTGSVYGFVVGGVIGFVLATLWNFCHLLFIGFAVLKAGWFD